MEKIKAYYHLSRPISTITGALAVLLGGYVAQTGVWWPVLLAALVTFIAGASSNAFNYYLDIEIDRINQPQRVLPSGQLAPRDALVWLSRFVKAAFFYICLRVVFLRPSNNVLCIQRDCFPKSLWEPLLQLLYLCIQQLLQQ